MNLQKKISPQYDAIQHQNAKLRLAHFETCLSNTPTNGKDNTEPKYSQSFELIVKMLRESSLNGFVLSANLLSLIYSTPSPLLFNAGMDINMNYIDAFYILFLSITESLRRKEYYREIDYSVRQAVGLLLKGYVKLKDDYCYKKGERIRINVLEIGSKNTFSLNQSTLKLANYLLQFVDGIDRSSLDYYRAIIKIYENQFEEAKVLLDNDKNNILNQIVLNYKFGTKYDIDDIIKKTWKKAMNMTNSIDTCHPFYWAVIDPMNLEISLNPQRKCFYDTLLKNLDNSYKKILELST